MNFSDWIDTLLVVYSVCLAGVTIFFVIATIMLQLDINRNSRNGIGIGLRNVLAISGLFIAATTCQTVATIYRQSAYYLDALTALLIVELIIIVLMTVAMAQLVRAMMRAK